jgi:hypothetical protein
MRKGGVMSKERELLFRWVDIDVPDYKLLADTKELLAQPEQSEQKPTAWVYQWKEGNGMYLSYFKLGEKPPRMCKFSMRNLRALYTSPLKSKPLSKDEIREGMKDEPPISCSGFIRGVKFAEQFHKVGEYGIGADNETL